MGHKIWVDKSAFEQIFYHTVNDLPYESGGMLLGYWADEDFNQAVVTHVFGPSKRARQDINTYTSSAADDRERLDAYRIAYPSNIWLGYWHSHPHGVARLSQKDKAALKSTAREMRVFGINSGLSLVAGYLNEEIDVMGWQAKWVGWRYKISKLELEVY